MAQRIVSFGNGANFHFTNDSSSFLLFLLRPSVAGELYDDDDSLTFDVAMFSPSYGPSLPSTW